MNQKAGSDYIYTLLEVKKVEAKAVLCPCFLLELVVAENKELVCDKKANDLDTKLKITVDITGLSSNKKYNYAMEEL